MCVSYALDRQQQSLGERKRETYYFLVLEPCLQARFQLDGNSRQRSLTR